MEVLKTGNDHVDNIWHNTNKQRNFQSIKYKQNVKRFKRKFIRLIYKIVLIFKSGSTAFDENIGE